MKSNSKKNLEDLDQYDYVDDEWIGEVSPDYIKAIGLFLIQFSSLEHTINLGIAEQINERTHFPGYQIIELLSTRNKIDLLSRMGSSYFAAVNPTQLAKFKEIISRIKGLNDFRNKLVHANWMSVERDGTVRTRIVIDSDEGQVQFERTKMTPELIHSKSNEISNIQEEFEEFLENTD